jgi:hypothetical protein
VPSEIDAGPKWLVEIRTSRQARSATTRAKERLADQAGHQGMQSDPHRWARQE